MILFLYVCTANISLKALYITYRVKDLLELLAKNLTEIHSAMCDICGEQIVHRNSFTLSYMFLWWTCQQKQWPKARKTEKLIDDLRVRKYHKILGFHQHQYFSRNCWSFQHYWKKDLMLSCSEFLLLMKHGLETSNQKWNHSQMIWEVLIHMTQQILTSAIKAHTNNNNSIFAMIIE